ncbi:MAG: EAL domain-containing protein, partial [Lachnospiraceae bacterium]|nr:EAL domain-containing protein [Lachnospiraceae bacterium]
EVEQAIRRAIDNRSFKIHYQPIWDSGTGLIHSAEALIRLIDDELGFISPEEFIRIAEHNGTIITIGEIVFEEVCRFIRDRDLDSLGMEFIEVNLSAVQCMQKDLPRYIIGTIKDYGVDGSQINLEVTESFAVQSEELLRHSMEEMRKEGITFSMDDFGTGYSNLQKVFSMGYDIVKIDKSILWAADEDFSARVLLESTIQMIKDMDRRIVVEGVETAEHRDMLKSLGVDFCQGFFFSRALAEEEFVDYVKNFNGAAA